MGEDDREETREQKGCRLRSLERDKSQEEDLSYGEVLTRDLGHRTDREHRLSSYKLHEERRQTSDGDSQKRWLERGLTQVRNGFRKSQTRLREKRRASTALTM